MTIVSPPVVAIASPVRAVIVAVASVPTVPGRLNVIVLPTSPATNPEPPVVTVYYGHPVGEPPAEPDDNDILPAVAIAHVTDKLLLSI